MTKIMRRFQLANAMKNTGKSLLAKWESRTGREQKDLFTGRLQSVFKYWMRKTFCGITFQIAECKDFNMICHMDFVIKSLKKN